MLIPHTASAGRWGCNNPVAAVTCLKLGWDWGEGDGNLELPAWRTQCLPFKAVIPKKCPSVAQSPCVLQLFLAFCGVMKWPGEVCSGVLCVPQAAPTGTSYFILCSVGYNVHFQMNLVLTRSVALREAICESEFRSCWGGILQVILQGQHILINTLWFASGFDAIFLMPFFKWLSNSRSCSKGWLNIAVWLQYQNKDLTSAICWLNEV